jgi:hypothetical protein
MIDEKMQSPGVPGPPMARGKNECLAVTGMHRGEKRVNDG